MLVKCCFLWVNGFTVVLMVFTGFKSGFTFCLRFNKARKGGGGREERGGGEGRRERGREGGREQGGGRREWFLRSFSGFGFETVGMVLKSFKWF